MENQNNQPQYQPQQPYPGQQPQYPGQEQQYQTPVQEQYQQPAYPAQEQQYQAPVQEQYQQPAYPAQEQQYQTPVQEQYQQPAYPAQEQQYQAPVQEQYQQPAYPAQEQQYQAPVQEQYQQPAYPYQEQYQQPQYGGQYQQPQYANQGQQYQAPYQEQHQQPQYGGQYQQPQYANQGQQWDQQQQWGQQYANGQAPNEGAAQKKKFSFGFGKKKQGAEKHDGSDILAGPLAMFATYIKSPAAGSAMAASNPVNIGISYGIRVLTAAFMAIGVGGSINSVLDTAGSGLGDLSMMVSMLSPSFFTLFLAFFVGISFLVTAQATAISACGVKEGFIGNRAIVNLNLLPLMVVSLLQMILPVTAMPGILAFIFSIVYGALYIIAYAVPLIVPPAISGNVTPKYFIKLGLLGTACGTASTIFFVILVAKDLLAMML